ncbi:hypothetical protein BHM03_00051836 [Ensete ventricosum]|nr:hypothetical protein BHM03_00051836 [Ensete ventricosum]
MDVWDSSLALEGCVSSLERRLVDRGPEWSPHTGVDFWSLVELQSLGVCYNILERVAYPRSGDLVWLASVGEAFIFVSASFCSSTSSPVTYTKASIGRWGCLDSAPSMIKLAKQKRSIGV